MEGRLEPADEGAMFIGRFQPAKVNMVLAAVVVWAFAFVIFAVVNTLVSSTPGVVVMVLLSLVWLSFGAIGARSAGRFCWPPRAVLLATKIPFGWPAATQLRHWVVRVPEDLLVHLRRARDLADRSYAEPLGLDELAAAAGVSKYHFLRCFTATYGRTPAVYLAERRIERAQDLLRATNLTVTEVCLLVGYTSLGSFSSKFRQLVGVSPSAYQAQFAAEGLPHIPGCYIFMHGLSDRRPDRATSEKPSTERPS